jgi:hypothetical protein
MQQQLVLARIEARSLASFTRQNASRMRSVNCT